MAVRVEMLGVESQKLGVAVFCLVQSVQFNQKPALVVVGAKVKWVERDHLLAVMHGLFQLTF